MRKLTGSLILFCLYTVHGRAQEPALPTGVRRIDVEGKYLRVACSSEGRIDFLNSASIPSPYLLTQAAPGFRYVLQTEDLRQRFERSLIRRNRVVDLSTGKVLLSLAEGSRNVEERQRSLGFSADGSRFVYFRNALGSREIATLDLSTAQTAFRDFPAGISDELFDAQLVLSNGGKQLAAYRSGSGSIVVYDMESKALREYPKIAPVEYAQEIPRATRAVLQFSPDDKKLLVGQIEGGQFYPHDVQVLHLESGRLSAPLFGGWPALHLSTLFSPDGTRVLALGMGGEISIKNVTTGAQVVAVKPPVQVSAVAFCPGSSSLVTSGTEGVHFWDLTRLPGPRQSE